MLPQVSRFGVRCAAVLVATAAIALAGCGEETTPEARVRAVIAAGEAAAEARDLAGILEHVVSGEFRDDRGGGRDELKQYAARLPRHAPVGAPADARRQRRISVS